MDYIKIEDCCEILDSQRVPITGKDRVAGEYPYYGANGVQGYVNEYIFDDDLVLVAEDGGYFGSKTKPIAYKVSGKCWVNNHAHVLKAKENVDTDYLCYSLMFYNVDKIVNGATRQKLNQKQLRQMLVPKRTKSKQLEIVRQLKTIERIIENKGAQLTDYDQLIKSRFVEMFGDIFNGKSNYPTVKISDVVIPKIERAKKDFNSDDEIKYVDISSVDNEKNIIIGYSDYLMKDAPSRAQQHVRKNDIVISTVRPNLNNVAKVSDDYSNIVASSGFCVLRASKVEPNFLFALVSMQSFADYLASLTTGANYPAVNDKDILNFEIPNAPFEEQTKFSDFIKQVDKLKFEVQKSLDETKKLFDSLMQEYFG